MLVAQREEAPELYKSLGSERELRFNMLPIQMEPQNPRGGMDSPRVTGNLIIINL